jgi:DNA-binding response OmpR family regulator
VGRRADRLLLMVAADPLIREVVTTSLAEHGFHVLEAASAFEARPTLSGEIPLDMLVCDLDLPDADGLDLAILARTNLPGIPVLFVTDRDQDVHVTSREVAQRPFQRPYRVMALRDAVARMRSQRGNEERQDGGPDGCAH